MSDLPRIALELLEYKLDALIARHQIRGGVASLWHLHGIIERGLGDLAGDERARFGDLARRLRAVAELPTRGSVSRERLDELRLDGQGSGGRGTDGPDAGGEGVVLDVDVNVGSEAVEDALLRKERLQLKALAKRVWWEELEEVVRGLAAAWRAERDRLTPRLVYATLRNLQRYANEPGFSHDTALSKFKVKEPLPEREDPLISLSDVDSLGELAREVIDLIMSLGQGRGVLASLEVPEASALAYVRQALFAVAKDPYAGRFSPLVRKGPSSGELRTALQELAKERLPEAQKAIVRRDLDARLAEALAFERNQREMFQRDVARCLEHAQALAERLERHLPTRVGGRAPGPRLAGGVLLAVNPALRWERVPPGAEAVTLRMVGPVRFTIGGHEVALMGSQDTRTLFVDGASHPLAPHLEVRVGRGRFLADVEGDYLYVRFRDEGASLATRLAEALAAAFVLTHDHGDALLAVVRDVAGARAAVPHETVRRAIGRAGEITSRAPQRRSAVEGLLRGAARAADVTLPDNLVLSLTERFMTALTVESDDLLGLLEREEGAVGDVHTITGEPLTVDLAGLKLTVRAYPGRQRDLPEQLVVMLPGRVIGSFSDILVEEAGDGTLVCARAEQEVAMLLLKGRPLTVASAQRR